MSKPVQVKWAGSNTPVIKLNRNDTMLVLNKRELLELRDEINAFMKYYAKDFKKHNIDWTDNDEP